MHSILADAQKLESRIKLIDNKHKLSYLHCKDIFSSSFLAKKRRETNFVLRVKRFARRRKLIYNQKR